MKNMAAAVLIFTAFNITYAQDLKEAVVAKVGDIVISGEEFQSRYELTPVFGKQIKGREESKKIEFLYSLIAEKLWAYDAKQKGLDNSEVISFAAEAFEKMFIRDELFRREIKNKITISDEEYEEGFRRENLKLKVNFLFSTDEEEINDLHNLLIQGIPFDSILAESPEIEEQSEPIEVKYGQMHAAVEDSLYNLGIGQFTRPLLTPDGWYIFILKNTVQNIPLDNSGKDAVYKNVKKIIEARKTEELYQQFYISFFADKKIDADTRLFKSLAEAVSGVLTSKKELYALSDTSLVYLMADDVIEVENRLGTETLSMPLLLFSENPFSVKKALRHLAFDGFSSKKTDVNTIAYLLDSRLKKLTEHELISREGYRQGLNFLPAVQNETAKWVENYLMQLLQNQFIDSVKISEEEIFAEYNRLYKKESYAAMVNIAEVLTADAAAAAEVIEKLNSGGDIKRLAAEYSIDKDARIRNGESGLVQLEMLGDIGRIAYDMEIGETAGPIKTNRGYSVIKLLDKVEQKEILPEPYERRKDEILKKLTFSKLKSKITNYTVTLALRYGFSADLDLLESIEVTNINSFGMRFIGFGGKITAVPISAPNTGWIEPYIKAQNLIQ